MKKILAILLSVLLLTSSNAFAQFSISFSSPTPEYTADEVLDRQLVYQTVSVMMVGDGIGTCSGTIVYEDQDNQYVLTAKHCVDVTEEMYVEHKKVIYTTTSASDDLALLAVKGRIPKKVRAYLGMSDALLGETVHHVAYPRKIAYKATGTVSMNTDDWQMYDFRAIGGCSGGGIFNVHGRLVGVLWGGYNNAPDDAPIKSIGEPLKDIRAFLQVVLPQALR